MSKEEQYKDDRLRWIAEQRKAGCNPYPNNFHRTDFINDLREAFATAERDVLEEQSNVVKVAGRLIARRAMGGTSFATLRDQGGDIQLMLARQSTDEKSLFLFKQSDVGDIVGVVGQVTKTQKGELTVRVKHLVILTKSLHPLPKEFYGLKDIEQRYRKRYLDLILNAASKDVFTQRAKIISSIRHFLDERNFTEVETPMMQQLAGGATARPFVTHHNALDMDLYLRVAPELFLKRLVIGGMEQVYEINRNFRNEGISTKHNPEFTMLEFYQAYASYQDLMVLTEEMLSAVCHAIKSTTVFDYQGDQYDFSKPFERLTMAEAILRYNTSLTRDSLYSVEELSEYATNCGIEKNGTSQLGVLQNAVFEKTVEHHLLQPTFITAFPLAVSPLARRKDDVPDEVDRFELFIAGMEIANGFSELNDSQDQNQRLQQQAKEKASGDEEAMHYDSDYIEALEYGLPPTAGEGVGIDRLVMLLTDSPSIRDVILFPYMRPLKG